MTAPISPGSSGGPVFTAAAEVVGLAVGVLTDAGRTAQNLNFAVPASLLLTLSGPARAWETVIAQEPVPPNAEGKKSPPGGHPFLGKLAAVDKAAKTIKVGESVYQITSETKITKDGKPATLDDGVVGEPVSGYAKPTDDGKMAATMVRFGAKAENKSAEKKNNK
jgi:hypothetical protein